MTKLSKAQITALTFLIKEPWIASWWGGKPHGTRPKELPAATLHKLAMLRYIRITHVGRFDRSVAITEAGLNAWKDATHEMS